jgi:outer membrane protein
MRSPIIFSLIFIPIFFLSTFTANSSAQSQFNLNQCFDAAVKKSETIAISTESIYQAEEKIRQAKGYLMPSINLSAGYLRQDALSPTDPNFGAGIKNQPLIKLTGTQPLFRGLRDFSALNQTKLTKDAQIQSKYQAKLDLYTSVASNFYSILTVEQELKNLNVEVDLLDKRAKEILDRVKIGRSRESEILTTQSSLAKLNAQIEALKGTLDVDRDILVFLTGFPKSTQLSDQTNNPEQLELLYDFLKNIDDRPDVKSAKLNLAIADKNLWINKGAHFPSIDLNGNYYFKRTGSLENVDWDIGILATIPVFQGGVLASKVQESKSQLRQAQLSLSLVKRSAEEEISTIYNQLVSTKSQIVALEKAKALAEKNWIFQTREYKYGLVNNIEVIDALTSFQDTTRALDDAKFSLKLLYAELLASCARVPVIAEN